MSERIKVFALAGLDEDGRDCYVVEINDDIFILDAGSSLPDKNLPGVDYVLPNSDYLIKNKNKVRAYIITHGHDESFGSLRFFYKYCPAKVYCTYSTMVIIEGQLSIYEDKTKFDYVIVNPTDDIFITNRRVRFFQTCHNAINSFGVAISTDQGNIIYTSDFIINFVTEQTGYRFNLSMTSELAKEDTLLLMAESKAADKKGYCSPKHRINDLVEKYYKLDKRMFVVAYWQNMYRIREILRLAIKYNKKIYCYDQYTETIIKIILKASDSPNVSKLQFVKKEDLLRVKSTDLLILLLGHADDIFNEMKALARGTNNDKRIRLESSDVFMNVAIPRPIFETLATRAVDEIYRTGCQVVWLKNKDVHSMHAQEDDLRFALNIFKPKYYFPVRGHYTKLMANAKLAVSLGIGLNHMNVFILDNGMQLVFEEGKRPIILPNEVNGIDTAPVIVDGKGITKDAAEVVSIRQKLGVDGTVIIAATVSKSLKKIIAGPDCQMRGFVYVKEAEPLLKSVTQIFNEEVNGALNKNMDFEAAKNTIKERARWFIRRENGREPLIEPIILVKE